jgi:hypothetical protein
MAAQIIESGSDIRFLEKIEYSGLAYEGGHIIRNPGQGLFQGLDSLEFTKSQQYGGFGSSLMMGFGTLVA